MAYIKKKDGIYRNPNTGCIWELKGGVKRFYWSKTMLDYLRRYYATTKNDELAEWLGVSSRTVIRKARELGLSKDRQWLAKLSASHAAMAHMVSRSKGYPGSIKKGEHRNPEGEFKPGRKVTDEQRSNMSKRMKKWHLVNKARHCRNMRKAWQRRKEQADE